jgi:hypothetical protein
MSRIRAGILGLLVIGAIVCACLFWRAKRVDFQGVEVRDGAIYLPRLTGMSLVDHRETPESWYQTGGGHLTVGTERFVVRLQRGLPLWATRMPTPFKGHYLTRVSVCDGPSDAVMAVGWTESTEESGLEERRIALGILLGRTGQVLWQDVHALPQGLSAQVLTLLPWEGGSLALLGKASYSFPKVEAVLRIRWDGKAAQAAYDDPARVKDWWLMDAHDRPSGRSAVLGQRTSEDASAIKVLRAPEGQQRTIQVGGGIGSGGLDVASRDILLQAFWVGEGKYSLAAHDLRDATARGVRSPCAVVSWRGAACEGGRVFFADPLSDSCAVYMVDLETLEIVRLVDEESQNVAGRISLSGAVFVRDDAVFFATADSPLTAPLWTYRVYSVGVGDKTPGLLHTVRTVPDEDEQLMDGGVRFLIPETGGQGFWLGTASGIIVYSRLPEGAGTPGGSKPASESK